MTLELNCWEGECKIKIKITFYAALKIYEAYILASMNRMVLELSHSFTYLWLLSDHNGLAK